MANAKKNQNKSSEDVLYCPQAGDGTLVEKRKQEPANWYGHSVEPHEEFIHEFTVEVDLRISPRNGPIAPDHLLDDVFPFGGPGQQSDG